MLLVVTISYDPFLNTAQYPNCTESQQKDAVRHDFPWGSTNLHNAICARIQNVSALTKNLPNPGALWICFKKARMGEEKMRETDMGMKRNNRQNSVSHSIRQRLSWTQTHRYAPSDMVTANLTIHKQSSGQKFAWSNIHMAGFTESSDSNDRVVLMWLQLKRMEQSPQQLEEATITLFLRTQLQKLQPKLSCKMKLFSSARCSLQAWSNLF